MLADHHLHVDAEVVGMPRTSMTRPMGGRVGVGQLVISTSTTRPSRLSCAAACEPLRARGRDAAWRPQSQAGFLAGRDEDGLGHAVVEGTTCGRTRDRSARSESADDGGLRRSMMRTMRPIRRPSALGGSTSTRTWSPCMAPLISLGGMKMSSARRRPGARWGGRIRSRRDADRGGRRRGCRACRVSLMASWECPIARDRA
jgi:hypothetical protein